MKKFLITLHRWLGVPLGLLFIVTFGTGCLTAVDELLHRVDRQQLSANYEYAPTTIEQNAAAIEKITADKPGIRAVTLPTPSKPYYQVVARGETWTYAINDLDNAAHYQEGDDGFFHTVLDLHRHFLLGKEGLFGVQGKEYAAWVGLLALLLSLLGLWLWWPSKKTFKVKDMLPRGKKRKHFYYSHMTSGVVVLAVIVLLGLTGASITYRSITQQLFGVERDKASTMATIVVAPSWQAWLTAAQAAMPEGAQLDSVRFPRQPRNSGAEQRITSKPANSENTTPNNKMGNRANSAANEARKNTKGEGEESAEKIFEFKFNAAGNWFGIASSSVKIDKTTSTLKDVNLFSQQTFGEKFYSILVPLHTGRQLPAAYAFVLLVFSFFGTVMVLSGLVSFATKKRKWKKAKRANVLETELSPS